MAARQLGLSLAVTLGLAAAGCIQDDGTRFNPIPGQKRMSPDTERELGWDFDHQAEEILPLVIDLEVLEFVQELGQLLVDRLGEQPFDYRFRVVEHASLNAFAVPGGYIYFHSGTLLRAGDVQELVGVLAHELAHVQGHHYARMTQQAALPSLLTRLAAIGATVATGEAAPLIAADGVNVAVQLAFTREIEDEADRAGAAFMSRAGYDPIGMARFFERILEEQERLPLGAVPPYLYSHPDVEQRIAVVEALSEELRPVGVPPDLEERLRDVQARLAYLVARGHDRPTPPAAYDRAWAAPELARAAELVEAGDPQAALDVLLGAELAAPDDPRVPMRRGEILSALGRPEQAVRAYRRALELDPNPAAVFLALGRAHRDAGDRRAAIFYLEHAKWRADAPRLRRRADYEIERLVFPVVADSGFADGSQHEGDTVAGTTRERFGPGDTRAAWWFRIGPRYLDWRDEVRVRWTDPTGRVVREEEPEQRRRVYLSSVHRFDGPPAPGAWRVALLREDDVLHEESVLVAPSYD
ncbi:MAG: M48 family metalloprotease [Myxococcota bacterium]|nr:M48 family metalloprotease [Myxococcota bacterium]